MSGRAKKPPRMHKCPICQVRLPLSEEYCAPCLLGVEQRLAEVRDRVRRGVGPDAALRRRRGAYSAAERSGMSYKRHVRRGGAGEGHLE